MLARSALSVFAAAGLEDLLAQALGVLGLHALRGLPGGECLGRVAAREIEIAEVLPHGPVTGVQIHGALERLLRLVELPLAEQGPPEAVQVRAVVAGLGERPA